MIAREVVVAFEEVLFCKVTFWRVLDPVTRRVAKLLLPEKVLLSESKVLDAPVEQARAAFWSCPVAEN